MLFEQSFYALPEVLHGSGYQKQDYEAGIINAFTLAVLQVLNGRNVNNPIGCIQAEKLFREKGKYLGNSNPRYLRADLFLDVSRLYVANKRLSQYGWRHNLWLEGKFLRGQAGAGSTHCGNKTNYVASYIADLIRLSTLVPETVGEDSIAGRYFLHVYDAHPQYYLTFRNRNWCKRICESGTHDIQLSNLSSENATVRGLLGELDDLELALNVTNTCAWPVSTDNGPIYWCCLTRINTVKASARWAEFKITENRKVEAKDQTHFDFIAAFVASRLHIKADSSEAKASADELTSTDSDES